MPPRDTFRLQIRRELALASTSKRRPARRLRLTTLAALLWGLASGPAQAQPPYRQEIIAGFSSLDVGSRASPEIADTDGDGDCDLVIGEWREGPRLFVNTGSSATAAFIERTGAANPFAALDVGYATNADLVDLDGDGDLDAIVGEREGTLRYFENTGSSSAPVFVQRLGTASPFGNVDVGLTSIPDLVDLDADGDLDAVVGSQLGDFRFFANTGSFLSPAFVERTGTSNPFQGIDVGLYSAPKAADLNGDGIVDFVSSELAGILNDFEGNGSSTPPFFVERTGAANPFDGIWSYRGDPDLMDLDGDSDLDLVIGGRRGDVRFFLNTGTSSAPAFVQPTGAANPTVGVVFTNHAGPELGDLDGDSDLDVIVGESTGVLRTFRNTGSSLAPAFVELTGAANPLAGIDVGNNSDLSLVDLDGDGDLDAILCAPGTVQPLYFENTGSSIVAAFVERTGTSSPFGALPAGFRTSIDLADLDGDGDLDAVAGRTFEGLRYLVNTGSSSAPAFMELTGAGDPFSGIKTSYKSTPDLVDLDRDGDVDVVAGASYGTLQYLENTGTSSAPAFVLRLGAASPFFSTFADAYNSNPVLADLDGDADLDLLVGEYEGHIVFFRSTFADVFADGFESGDVSAWSEAVP